MTLLRKIQNLLERTYAPIGVNLEDFIIGPRRSVELARMSGKETDYLSHQGRVYLRKTGEALSIAVYYSPGVISRLENNHPLETLSDINIRDFITFIEEINHALHAILLFLDGQKEISSASFLSNLELQGKIDTYLVLKHCISRGNGHTALSPSHKRWLDEWLFDRETFSYPSPQIAERYREANQMGRRFIRKLDKKNAGERINLIRILRPLPYDEKKKFILSA
ncbi:MAG: hypothetical protein SGI98_04910 [Verrucomicrobiota bacterium]|nr:hypothetical protein [Verrucomicrobiota bacterium]